MTAARSLHDLRYADLEDELASAGVARAHARTLWRSLYTQKAPAFLPPLARWMEHATFTRDEPEIAAETASADGLTHKLLLRLTDGQTIETVIMRYCGRATACLSTQAGCAMGCVFCATGQMGFTRHLRPGEIVAQALAAQRHLCARGEPGLRNLVLMGMGEPLHNYDAVMTALGILADTRGLNLGPSRVTISTVGVVPGILRLAAENQPYNLAVSLHGATEESRAALVPVARRWPLADLIAACRTYAQQTCRRIFFEWTLIAGTNDSPTHATQLAALLSGLDAHVNLIPLNSTDGYPGAPSTAAAHFQRILREANIPSTIRQRRGLDVAAGCGQLRARR
jgi:23S rRNA (adenine2503-C2)-methyltransferase